MHLEDIIRGVEIAEQAKSRRKTQAFTAEEEPIVIKALLSCSDVLARLLMEDTTNGYDADSERETRKSS
jgi:hypothetical protein